MKKLVPLVILFVVLLALTAYRETGRPTSDSLSAELDLRPVAAKPFKEEDVTRISVAGPGHTEPDFTIERTGDTWTVDRPFRAPAAAGSVLALIEAVRVGEGELRSTDPSIVGLFHLAPESRTLLTVEGEGGAVLAQLAVGKTSGRSGAFVSILGGENAQGVYAVTNDLRGALGLPRTMAGDVEPEAPRASTFHDSMFPPLELDTARVVTITTPRHEATFKRAGRIFVLDRGGPGGAQPKLDAVLKVLAQLSGALKPSGLADPAKTAEFGLDAPTHKVVVTLEDGTTRGFLAAEAEVDGKTVRHLRFDTTQDPPVIYKVADWDFAKLFPKGSEFFVFEAPKVNSATLGRILVESGDTRIELARAQPGRAAEWSVVSPQWPLGPNQSTLRNLAAALERLAPEDWVDGVEPEALADAKLTVRYGDVGAPDDALRTIRVGGEAPGGGRLAQLPNGKRIVVLPEATVERLVPTIFDLFEKRVFPQWDERLVHTIQVQRIEDGERKPAFVASALGGEWKIHHDGKADAANEEAVKEWVDRLLALSVEEQATGGADPEVFVTVKGQIVEPVTFGLSAVTDGARTLSLGGMKFRVSEDDLTPAARSLVPEKTPEEDTEKPGKDDGSDSEEKNPEEPEKGDDE